MIELPEQEPCEFCEGMAGRDPTWAVIEECTHTMTAINPSQYEVGQCCVITKRHVGTLLELTDEEAPSIIKAAQRAAIALVNLYRPLGILTFQNNGVYSGQEVPHYHFHVVPRQPEGGACKSTHRCCTRPQTLFGKTCRTSLSNVCATD